MDGGVRAEFVYLQPPRPLQRREAVGDVSFAGIHDLMAARPSQPAALTIAGSDSSGGAGLQTTSAAITDSILDEAGCYLLINGWAGGNALTQHRPHVIYNYSIQPFSFSAEL